MKSDVKFENDVVMYGTQTICSYISIFIWFENDVEMYGTQTYFHCRIYTAGLRMM